MNPFTDLLLTVIGLYSDLILVWFVLGLLIHFKIVNRNQPLVYKVEDFLSRLIDPVLNPIRKYLPPINGIDISPMVLILLLHFVQRSLVYYF